MNKTLFAAGLLLALVSCKKEKEEPTENLGPVRVAYFYPEAAPVGATITVLGTNFSSTPANNTVSFNAGDAKAFAFSKGTVFDTLRVLVPANAATGPLTVRVYAQTTVAADPFTLVAGRWARRADCPGGAGMFGTGFSIGGKTYVVVPGTNELWAYDPAQNQWAKKASSPAGTVALTSRSGELLSFVAGSYAYVGVYLNDYPVDEVRFYRYDPATDQWGARSAVPHIDAHHAAVFGLLGKGYLVDLDPDTKGVYEYDPQTNAWAKKGPFPGVGRYASTSFAIGEKGYLGGGNTGTASALLQDFWQYNPLVDTWTREADLPATNDEPNGFAANGQGFMVSSSNLVYAYNPATNAWRREADFPGRAYTGKVSISGSSKGYVARGRGAGNDLYTEFWEFSPN